MSRGTSPVAVNFMNLFSRSFGRGNGGFAAFLAHLPAQEFLNDMSAVSLTGRAPRPRGTATEDNVFIGSSRGAFINFAAAQPAAIPLPCLT